MKVCGVDPAPGKGLQVFDGEDRKYPVERARGFLETIREIGEVLVTWDAPLSGPPACVLDGAGEIGPAFTQRPIESFFGRKATGFKAPVGISVLGYSGCQHWTISRSLVGLPRVGPFDAAAESLPFRLVSDDAQRPICGCHIVEVHPAVALWLWCDGKRAGDTASWRYKTEDDVRRELWKILPEQTAAGNVLGFCDPQALPSDDQLDARVAYALGRLWLDESDSVVLLGDLDSGTFLVPRVDGIVEAFDEFVTKNAPRAVK